MSTASPRLTKPMTLNISARTLAELVNPVLPHACKDQMLPVLNAVRIESKGSHLLASATDRFRIGMKRMAAPVGEPWPEFQATIPVSALRSIASLFKPGRGSDVDLVLTVTDDDRLTVEASGLMLDLLGATATYALELGEYPDLTKLLREAIEDEGTMTHTAVNPAFLADFKSAAMNGVALGIKMGSLPSKPIFVTNAEDFVGLLMPRRTIGGDGRFPDHSDWMPLLASPEPKKAPAKKAATRKPKAAAS